MKRRILTFLILLSGWSASAVLLAEEALDSGLNQEKVHVFMEHGVFFGLGSDRLLDFDLRTGQIQLLGPDGSLSAWQVKARPELPSLLDQDRVLWLGSADVASTKATAERVDHASDVAPVGGSLLLGYEQAKWQNKLVRARDQDIGQLEENCSGTLTTLTAAVAGVLGACGECRDGAVGADALDHLDQAMVGYMNCVEQII